MAVTFKETLLNDLQTSGNEVNLGEIFSNGKHDAFFEYDNNSQRELFYCDNEQEEIEERFSRIFMEKIKGETQENFKNEKEEDTVQFHKLEPILSDEDFSHLVGIPVKSYYNSYILDDIEDEYKEEKEVFEHTYEDEKEADEFSYYKQSDEGSREKIISIGDEVLRKSLTIEERINLITQIRSAMNEHKILKLKNNYLHQNCCKVLVACSRMDTVEKGLDQTMVHNDLRYKVTLEEYYKMKFKTECRMNLFKIRTQNLETNLLSIETEFNKVSDELSNLEFEQALGLRISGTGRRLSEDDTKKLIEKRKQRSLEMTQVRITYIQYKNILKNINNNLCKLESLGLGLTTEYYGNLLRHKQSLMDRVEEQRENIRKLQKIYFTYPVLLNVVRENSIFTETYITEQMKKWEEFNNIEERIQNEVVALGRKRAVLRTKNHKLKTSIRFLENPIMMKQRAITKAKLTKKCEK
ncbi:uncharacterized protein LOC117173117 [Belonocnema kinseyi]|uniref:uncharacterized protein LOC117173117 n=1 Tax=Belonocnema kinseyi TaxID=2817044 RepID=UPI00143DFD79|nr:uncharacterized protein LOC117173117 [Belonocnema kinseyi]